MTTVSVFGGTGFLGQRLVRHLASQGTAVRVAVRHPDQARSAFGAPGMERVTVFRADVRDRDAVAGAVAGADAGADAVVAGGILPGLRELNIMPRAVEEIVPTYLGPAHKMEETVR
jgi:NADH dehydrogenase